MGSLIYYVIRLFYDFHFIDKPFRISKFINDEKDVFSIHHDISAETRVVVDITHRSLPLAVKIKPNQIPTSIQRWTS